MFPCHLERAVGESKDPREKNFTRGLFGLARNDTLALKTTAITGAE